MMDLFFFFKTLALTVVLVLLLQFKVGSSTLENHAMSFFQSSAISQPLNQAARGGAKIIRDMVHSIHEKINSKFGSKDPSNKKPSGFKFGWDS